MERSSRHGVTERNYGALLANEESYDPAPTNLVMLVDARVAGLPYGLYDLWPRTGRRYGFIGEKLLGGEAGQVEQAFLHGCGLVLRAPGLDRQAENAGEAMELWLLVEAAQKGCPLLFIGISTAMLVWGRFHHDRPGLES